MKHILIVDDEPHIREILRHILVREGYRVSDVESAREAVDIVRREPPHLIISDLQLEEADGFEFIDQVKQVAPNVPVILLTGVLFDPTVVQQLQQQSKVAAYIEKTSSLERILGEVKRVLA